MFTLHVKGILCSRVLKQKSIHRILWKSHVRIWTMLQASTTGSLNSSVIVPSAALVWFHTHLILSNPGAFAFILRHHKSAQRTQRDVFFGAIMRNRYYAQQWASSVSHSVPLSLMVHVSWKLMMSSSAKTHAEVTLLPEQVQMRVQVAFTGIVAQFQCSRTQTTSYR